jgi:hypothetical protein
VANSGTLVIGSGPEPPFLSPKVDLDSLPRGAVQACRWPGGVPGGAETKVPSGSLTNGWTTIKLNNLTVGATVRVRAHVTDRAGNQGTSSVATMQIQSVSNPWW